MILPGTRILKNERYWYSGLQQNWRARPPRGTDLRFQISVLVSYHVGDVMGNIRNTSAELRNTPNAHSDPSRDVSGMRDL